MGFEKRTIRGRIFNSLLTRYTEHLLGVGIPPRPVVEEAVEEDWSEGVGVSRGEVVAHHHRRRRCSPLLLLTTDPPHTQPFSSSYQAVVEEVCAGRGVLKAGPSQHPQCGDWRGRGVHHRQPREDVV